MYVFIEPMVPMSTNFIYYKSKEHVIDWDLFGNLDKVYFFKQASDMIYAEVLKATKIEKRMRESLSKVGDLLKVEKWATRDKQIAIKELEEKIVVLR